MTDLEYLKKYMKEDLLSEGIKRLENGEPVQYIVGNVDFYGNIFEINKDVLIPRFETEELVYKTINYVDKYFSANAAIVDLGTGSGCIAITLKKKMPNCSLSAVDISDNALLVAKRNANKLNADIIFYNGDMLEPLDSKFDVIISNPPYISYDEEIMEIVKKNEPHIALFADNDGLYFYEEILMNAHKYLNKKSIIAFEIGYTQAESIKKIALKYFENSKVVIEKDIQGNDRFIFIFNNI